MFSPRGVQGKCSPYKPMVAEYILRPLPSTVLRRCPTCDRVSDKPLCPTHGTATILLERPLADPSLLSQGYSIGDRYVIRRLIGRGGFGSVFAAKHTGTGQDVAVKVLIQSGSDDDSLKYFHREAQVTSGLRHPNTIRVFDFGEDKAGFLYLAMELLTGQSVADALKDRLERGEVFSQEEAIDIGVGVTKSLAEAHAAGLIHRDLKPDNIFLHQVEGDDPIVKVLDFGIVKVKDHQHTNIRGTPGYMSPEQITGEPLDGRSDLYSLGMVLFRLVTGRLPFMTKDLVETLRRQVMEPAPKVRDWAQTPVSDAFANLIDRLLSKSREDRVSDARRLRGLLEQCREQQLETRPVSVLSVDAFDAQDTISSLKTLEAKKDALAGQDNKRPLALFAGVFAVGTICAMVIAVLVMRAFGESPAAEIAKPTLSEKPGLLEKPVLTEKPGPIEALGVNEQPVGVEGLVLTEPEVSKKPKRPKKRRRKRPRKRVKVAPERPVEVPVEKPVVPKADKPSVLKRKI